MAHINEKDELEDCASCSYARLDGSKLICTKTEKQVNDNDWCDEWN